MENEKESKKNSVCKLEIEDCDFCVIKNSCPLESVEPKYSTYEINEDHVYSVLNI